MLVRPMPMLATDLWNPNQCCTYEKYISLQNCTSGRFNCHGIHSAHFPFLSCFTPSVEHFGLQNASMTAAERCCFVFSHGHVQARHEQNNNQNNLWNNINKK